MIYSANEKDAADEGLSPSGTDEGISSVQSPSVLASLGDLSYIDALGIKEHEAVGFIPRTSLEEYVRKERIWLQRDPDSGEPCGYLLWGMGWPVLRVYQACIQYDARRLTHATSLVFRLETLARSRGFERISLWCAEELPANAFWSSCGFVMAETKMGGKRRGRLLNRWELKLPDPAQRQLFTPRSVNKELERAVVDPRGSTTDANADGNLGRIF